jgi:hypothetical protein
MAGLFLGNDGTDSNPLSGTCHQAVGNYIGDVWTFTSPDPTNYFNGTGKVHDRIN